MLVGCAVVWAVVVVIGSTGDPASAAPTSGLAPPAHAYGYRMVASDGGVFDFGGARFFGSMGGHRLNQPVVGLADLPGDVGYWEVAADGGIFAFGDAPFHGSMGDHPLNQPVIGMLSSDDGGGYLLFASDGGIFAFGDAVFHGSLGGTALTSPVVGVAATPGGGYWILQQDGTVTPFGDAMLPFGAGTSAGSGGAVAIGATPDGNGYWLTYADGTVSAYGDASTWAPDGGTVRGALTGGVGTPDGLGYWTTDGNGGVAAYGDAAYLGSMAGVALDRPVVAISALVPPPVNVITYPGTTVQSMRVYPSPGPGAPVVVLVHGGGFSGGSATDPLIDGEATYLQASGVTVFVPDYDLAGDGTPAFPMQVDDVVAAVRDAEAVAGEYDGDPGVDGSGVTLIGGSAGGTLAALAAGQVAVEGVVDLSGIADFSTYLPWITAASPSLGTSFQTALGCTATGCTLTQLLAWSPADQPVPPGTRWLVGSGNRDPIVPESQGQQMAAALQGAGADVVVDDVTGGAHAFELCPWLDADVLALVRS